MFLSNESFYFAMKKIEAIIRNEKLYEVKAALDDVGAKGLTTYEVKGAGNQKGGIPHESGRPGTFKSTNLIPKTKVEIVCDDKDLNSILDIIQKTARTGNVGDGKIFVYPLENAIRIRTGESGTVAV